jgi:histidinol-phosphate aminotransferase
VIECPIEWRKNESETLKELIGAINTHRPKAVFLCNPNNPTGQYFSRKDIETLISNLGDTLLILDEAYVNFVDKPWSSLPLIDLGNIIILRSMTKDYGLAGLRLGYAVAGVNIINTLHLVCPPWNVNSAAQQAGIAALDAEDFFKQSLRRIQQAKLYLIRELNKIGLTTLPSKTNFFLLKVRNGKAFRQNLMKQGVLVRDCTSFGLPEHVRLAPRTLTDCQKLIVIINKLHEKGGLIAGI